MVWSAKKSLLDRAVLAQGGWKTFYAWGRWFEAASLRAVSERSFEDVLRRKSFLARYRLRRLAARLRLDPGEFHERRALYLQARKIDLRFHELGAKPGYQRLLESEGLIDRLTVEEDVELAGREPPRDTRARIRGYYIQRSSVPESLQVNWHEIELQNPSRHIPLPDPFFCRLPSDG